MFFLRYLVLGIALFIIFIGLLSFGFGIISASGLVIIGSFEFPLGDPTGIIINRNAEIFCNLQFYQRIQVYDHTGKFLRSWQVPNTNPFVLGLDENDLIVVESSDSSKYIYDSYGNLLPQSALLGVSISDTYEALNTSEIRYAKNFCFDTAGNRYEVYNRLLYPHIIKITPEEKSTILVKMPIYYLLVTGPIWPWFEILFGFILLAILQILQEKIPKLGNLAVKNSLGKKKKNVSTEDSVMIPLYLYLLLEPLAIIIGSVLSIAIILYFHNLMELTFTRVSATVFFGIFGIHIALHSIFSPICSLCNSKMGLHKISDKPLQYRCKYCGNIYTQNTIEE